MADKRTKKTSPAPPCIQHVKLVACLRFYVACQRARYWIGDPHVKPLDCFWDRANYRSPKALWDTCPNSSWMLWLLDMVLPSADLYKIEDLSASQICHRYPWSVVAGRIYMRYGLDLR